MHLSKDGNYLFTGSGNIINNEDNIARMWDVQTGIEIIKFEGH